METHLAGSVCIWIVLLKYVRVPDGFIELRRASLPPSASLLCIPWQSGT